MCFLSQPFVNLRTAGEGGGISVTPYYHFHPLHRQTLVGQLMQTAHLCIYVAARLKPRNFSLRVQATNQ